MPLHGVCVCVPWLCYNLGTWLFPDIKKKSMIWGVVGIAVKWFDKMCIVKWWNWSQSYRLWLVITVSFLLLLPCHFRNLSNNRITTLEAGCFDNLSGSLLVVKLNRNRISMIPPKVFKLPHLQFLWVTKLRIVRDKFSSTAAFLFKLLLVTQPVF